MDGDGDRTGCRRRNVERASKKRGRRRGPARPQTPGHRGGGLVDDGIVWKRKCVWEAGGARLRLQETGETHLSIPLGYWSGRHDRPTTVQTCSGTSRQEPPSNAGVRQSPARSPIGVPEDKAGHSHSRVSHWLVGSGAEEGWKPGPGSVFSSFLAEHLMAPNPVRLADN
ncbi:hypothetical protein NEUTE2DRAFT_67502 [Neurospora tetrasperma FGSC 2509]|nr:hypothetical protein NEUTE2DRAFT_67502 [Neurospora tetrasperma FGSC 2509]